MRDGRHVLVELSNELGIGDDGLVALFLNDLLPVAADVARHRVLEGSTPLLAGGSHCRRLTAAVVGGKRKYRGTAGLNWREGQRKLVRGK